MSLDYHKLFFSQQVNKSPKRNYEHFLRIEKCNHSIFSLRCARNLPSEPTGGVNKAPKLEANTSKPKLEVYLAYLVGLPNSHQRFSPH